MANRLSVAEVQSILTLHGRGWSCRKIARVLGLHRETVSNYVRQARAPAGAAASTSEAPPPGTGLSEAGPKPATAPIGWLSPAAAGVGSKPATAPLGSPPEPAPQAAGEDASVAGPPEAATPGRAQGPWPSGPLGLPRSPSRCQPYRELILAKLDQGLSAVRIHQDLLAQCSGGAEGGPDRGTPLSYHSVRRFIATLQRSRPDPFRRIECAPGTEAQVDFGRGAPVVGADGRRRRPHVLRVVLSHSRKGYSEAVFRQTTENFIRCLENAFLHFGGVTATLILDNLRAAVKRADWFDPEINPKVQSFCAHYGTVPLPTRPYTPRHKGKVERGIAYVQDNALKGRVFASLAEQNRHLQEWEAVIADKRLHGTTRKQVGLLFEQVERAALKPLPNSGGRFPFFHEGRRVVHRDGHVEVERAYYSAPPEYLGRSLWVRWDGRLVRLFDQRMALIATHAFQEPGKFSTLDGHILDRKIAGVERGAVWLLEKAGAIGPEARRWAEAMVQARGIEGLRVLQGLLGLPRKHPAAEVDRACAIALEHGAWRLRTLRRLLERASGGADQAHRQEHFEFLDEHPIIRSLSEYQQLIHQSFLQTPGGQEMQT
jgi:transposase